MPMRRRAPRSPAGLIVNPRVFRYGDGTRSFFHSDLVYRDQRTAERAWRQVRRDAWAATNYTQIPGAAKTYDGLTRDGFELLWFTWKNADFPASEVLEALADDRAAVAAFRQNDPRAARTIADYLDRWLTCLARWEDLTRVIAADGDRWRGSYGSDMTHGSGRMYGSIVANDDGSNDV
jgi:hypothetical protein